MLLELGIRLRSIHFESAGDPKAQGSAYLGHDVGRGYNVNYSIHTLVRDVYRIRRDDYSPKYLRPKRTGSKANHMAQHGIKYATQKPTYLSSNGVESARNPTMLIVLLVY